MMKRVPRRMVISAIPAAFWLGTTRNALAAEPVHYGTNSITFGGIGRSASPNVKGQGEIEYDGGTEPKSRWSSTFRFSGLNPETDYVVVVRGRFGENDSKEASEFSELCSFTSEADGSGSCFAYFRGLQRLDVVQLRQADDDRRVMQATRSSSGTGTITTVPNRFSETTLRRMKQGANAKPARAGSS